MFADSPQFRRVQATRMPVETDHIVEETDAPEQRREELDVRQLGPPKPLSKTLERLTELEERILVQLNDRAPQNLYPKLDDRGYAYETFEADDAVVTVIWER
jgi:hypothetical protein